MPLEQLWAGEIPRLEAEKRAAKQVGCMTREDKIVMARLDMQHSQYVYAWRGQRVAARRASALEAARRGHAFCVQACEEADAALRKKLGRRLRKIDRKMDHGFQEALARLHAVCTELDGARRPIDWDV